MGRISELVLSLSAPIAAEQSVEIWKVEFVKEGGTRLLRVYLDHKDGVSIEMCENFSRALEKKLDELDPIEESYVLEVSSPGIERELRRPADFERFLGSRVRVTLYRAAHGARIHEGTLKAYSGEGLLMSTSGGELLFDIKAIAKATLAFEF